MKRMATFRDYVGELTVTYKRTSKPAVKIKTSKDVADYIRPYYNECMDNHEEVKIMHLNNANNVCNIHHLSSGGQTGSVIDIKLSLREALQINCQAVILIHNHPSGTTIFSEADLNISRRLKKAFEAIDIRMLDSMVITRETYVSMADDGLL